MDVKRSVPITQRPPLIRASCDGFISVPLPATLVERVMVFPIPAFETVNEEADEKVVFLKLGTLVVEAYENNNFSIASALFIDRLPISVGLPL